MYLLYFRFDDQGEVVTMHVRCDRLTSIDELVNLAKQHGLTSTARLVEYASFSATGPIRPRDLPSTQYYPAKDFRDMWARVEVSAG